MKFIPKALLVFGGTISIFFMIVLMNMPDIEYQLGERVRAILDMPRVIVITSTQEMEKANMDHAAIGRRIQNCLSVNPSEKMPASLKAVLRPFGFQNNVIDEDNIGPKLAGQYFRVAELSSTLMNQRVTFDLAVSRAYVVAQVGTWLTVVIGLLTTIFVGINSSDLIQKDSSTGIGIRLGTLCLPAIGTAVAAIIAFYNPSGQLARLSQQTTALQQLHAQLVGGFWKSPCLQNLSDKAAKDVDERVDAWPQRYQEILALNIDGKSASGSQPKQEGQGSKEPAK